MAAIDVGSVSVHLLAARATPDGALVPVAEESSRPMLGARRDRSGAIPADAEADALAALGRYCQQAAGLEAEAIVVVATEAVRAAPNGKDVAARWSTALGLPVTILTTDQETRLALLGAFAGRLPAAGLFADVGGASTQVAAIGDGAVAWQRSLPIGAASVAPPIAPAEIPPARWTKRLARTVQAALAALPPAPAPGSAPVISGGTARILASLSFGDHRGDVLTSRGLEAAEAALAATSAATLARVYGMPPERATVILAGCVLLRGLFAWSGHPVWRVGAGGLREGIVRTWSAGSDRRFPTADAGAERG